MSSSNEVAAHKPILVGLERLLHKVLGRGKLAEHILPWKYNIFSGSVILFSWYLFEVVECNFVTLLCHILMAIMLILFGWYNATGLIPWRIPKIDDVKIQESTFKFFNMKLNSFLKTFYDISIGKDLKLFFKTLAGLFVMTIIGNCFTTSNLIHTMLLCRVILPAMYEWKKSEVDNVNQEMKRLLNTLNSNVLAKIPRGSVKKD